MVRRFTLLFSFPLPCPAVHLIPWTLVQLKKGAGVAPFHFFVNVSAWSITKNWTDKKKKRKKKKGELLKQPSVSTIMRLPLKKKKRRDLNPSHTSFFPTPPSPNKKKGNLSICPKDDDWEVCAGLIFDSRGHRLIPTVPNSVLHGPGKAYSTPPLTSLRPDSFHMSSGWRQAIKTTLWLPGRQQTQKIRLVCRRPVPSLAPFLVIDSSWNRMATTIPTLRRLH